MVLTDLGYYILICLVWAGIFIIFWAICGFFIYRFVDRKLRSCPSCKRGASGSILTTEIEPMGMQIDHAGKKSMQVKSEKVTDHYQCKHCEHTWLRTYERKERIPLDEQA
jgi:hypothetical protein